MKLFPDPRWSLRYKEPAAFYRYCYRRDGPLGNLAKNLQLLVFSIGGALLFSIPHAAEWKAAISAGDPTLIVEWLARAVLIIFVGFGIMLNVLRFWRTETGGLAVFYENGLGAPKRVMPFSMWRYAELSSLIYEKTHLTVISLLKDEKQPFGSLPTEIGISAEDNLEPLLDLLRQNGITILDHRGKDA